MSEQDNEQLDSTNQPVEEAVVPEEVQEDQVVETDDVESEVEDTDRLKEMNKKLFERAKKAEAELKAVKAQVRPTEKPTNTPSNVGVPVKDIIALSKVDPEDVEEVMEFAKYKKTSVIEALKTSTLKTILSQRADERKTAQAAFTGKTQRPTNKVTDEALLKNALEGNIPESDDEVARVVAARAGLKSK